MTETIELVKSVVTMVDKMHSIWKEDDKIPLSVLQASEKLVSKTIELIDAEVFAYKLGPSVQSHELRINVDERTPLLQGNN